MLIGALIILGATLPDCNAYCALLGQNPGFSAPPKVEQISLTSVRVSWEGLVTRIDCADQFIVKSWNARNPNDYQMSDLLPVTQFSYTVTDLVPNQNYVFQVHLITTITREIMHKFPGSGSGGQGHPGKGLEQVTACLLQDHQFKPYSCTEKGKAKRKGAGYSGRAKTDPKDPFHYGCNHHWHSVGESYPCRDILEHSPEQEEELRFWQ